MGLQEYLAKNYLSASKPTNPLTTTKKRKRKPAESTNLTIADDNDTTWTHATNGSDDDADPDGPTITTTSSSLKSGLNRNPSSKKPTWRTIGSAAPSNTEQAAADAILADAAHEAASRTLEDDEAPAIVDNDDTAPTMASGAAAGLQSAADVAAALRRREKAEKKAMRDAGLDGEAGGLAATTIYRDASGRMINVKAAKEAGEEREREKARREREEVEMAKGDVQRREKEERRRELEVVRGEGVARGIGDVRMNEELKERERWNDPMAQLIASKKGNKEGREGKGGKAYAGAAEPNRYGIRPGWRWDGVDRSNGFERKWFAARNKASERKELEYMWQMDE